MRQWKGTGKDARLSIVSLHLYRPSGRRGAAEVLSPDRRCQPSTRQGARPERLRSRGDCRAWDILAEGAGWKRLLVVGRWISFTIQPAKTHEPRRAQSITKVSSLTRLLRVRSWPLWLAISQIDPLPLQRIDKFYH